MLCFLAGDEDPGVRGRVRGREGGGHGRRVLRHPGGALGLDLSGLGGHGRRRKGTWATSSSSSRYEVVLLQLNGRLDAGLDLYRFIQDE
jgi:hypothetical protein